MPGGLVGVSLMIAIALLERWNQSPRSYHVPVTEPRNAMFLWSPGQTMGFIFFTADDLIPQGPDIVKRRKIQLLMYQLTLTTLFTVKLL